MSLKHSSENVKIAFVHFQEFSQKVGPQSSNTNPEFSGYLSELYRLKNKIDKCI